MHNIQIFASDHRHNVDWNLPYIRIGGPESDCALNIKDDAEIAPYSVLLSEGAKMWWVYKHLSDFGNPDYVGFCHYRRFFTCLNFPMGLLDIPKHEFNSSFCLSPIDQLSILETNKIDAITMSPVLITRDNFTYIWDQLAIYDKTNPVEKHKLVFDIFYKNLPQRLQKYADNVFKIKPLHLCNIFTMRTDLFKEYSSIVFKTLIEYHNSIDISTMSKRYLGFYLERLTSCYLDLLHAEGLNIQCVRILTVDGNTHVLDTPIGESK